MQIHSIERFGMQRKIVGNMTTESWQEVPHVSCLYEPDVTEFYAAWQRLRKTPDFAGVTINTLLLYAITLGFLAAPEMVAHIRYHRRTITGAITRFNEINISMPTAMPNGKMMTLNVHNCEQKNLREIADCVASLRKKMEKTNMDNAMMEVSVDNTVKLLWRGRLDMIAARLAGLGLCGGEIHTLRGKAKREYRALPANERITKHDIEQGTVLISNWGSVYRGSYLAPALLEVVPPMVCSLGIGGFYEKPGIAPGNHSEKQLESRTFLPIGIMFDHRALDYDGVVPFCKCMDSVFKQSEQIQEWLKSTPFDQKKVRK